MTHSSPFLRGRRRGRVPVPRLAALLLALGAVVTTPPVTAATLDERLAALASARSETLHYEEQRASALLNRPVTVRGRLTWDPVAGELTKWVDEPREARLTITPLELRAETPGGRERRLPLERRPELAALFSGVRALLTGDTGALEDNFQASYHEGEGDAWVMHFVPRDEVLGERLELLEIRGHGDRVGAIDTLMSGGERQHMRILEADETGAGDDGAADPGSEAGGDEEANGQGR